MNEKNEAALEHKCPACNASIPYDPKVGKWKCSYCGSEFTLEELQANNTKNNENSSPEEINTSNNYISYKCQSCGAEIVADEQTAATFCVYCGNTAILKSKLSGEFTPDMVIPFKKTKEDAVEAFKNISKGKPLTPKEFNNPTNIEKIRGIYIPFWLYNLKVSGSINCDATKVDTWTVGDTRYTKTSTYNVTREGSMDFERIPVDASTHFDNSMMNTIEPFNYNELKKYNHAFLSGFYAEKYDVTSEDAYNEASDRALTSAKEKMLESVVGYTTKNIIKNNLASSQISKEYVMIPVWMVNVNYKNKMYLFAMNGQTGEFIGNIPLDRKKAVIYSIVIFIVTFLIGLLISYLAFKGGN